MGVFILLYRNKVIRNLYNFINFSFQPIVNTWTSSIWYVAEINLFKVKKHTRKVFSSLYMQLSIIMLGFQLITRAMPLKFSFVGLIVWGSVPSPRLTYWRAYCAPQINGDAYQIMKHPPVNNAIPAAYLYRWLIIMQMNHKINQNIRFRVT